MDIGEPEVSTLDKGSSARQASRTESDTWSLQAIGISERNNSDSRNLQWTQKKKKKNSRNLIGMTLTNGLGGEEEVPRLMMLGDTAHCEMVI